MRRAAVHGCIRHAGVGECRLQVSCLGCIAPVASVILALAIQIMPDWLQRRVNRGVHRKPQFCAYLNEAR